MVEIDTAAPRTEEERHLAHGAQDLVGLRHDALERVLCRYYAGHWRLAQLGAPAKSVVEKRPHLGRSHELAHELARIAGDAGRRREQRQSIDGKIQTTPNLFMTILRE